MAQARIPPPPTDADNKDAWQYWYLSVKDVLAQLAGTSHNNLANIQGGSTSERYHLTANQQNGLTGGGITTLHTHWYHAQANLDFGSIAANDTAELTISVPGAIAGAAVMVGAPASIETGLVWVGYVSATDTVTIRLHNTKGSSVDPANNAWHVLVEAH